MNTENPGDGRHGADDPDDFLQKRIDEFCARASERAYRLTVRSVGAFTARDLAQDVAVAVWKSVVAHPERLDDPKGLDLLVATTARRAVINWSLQNDRRDARELRFAESMEGLRVRSLHPGARALAEERRLALDEAIRRMPPRRAEVFLAVREDGMSHEDVAAKFDIKLQTVHSHMHHALTGLRDVLAEFGEPDFDPLWYPPARRRRTTSNEEQPDDSADAQGDDDE